jgi:hypothetical protein
MLRVIQRALPSVRARNGRCTYNAPTANGTTFMQDNCEQCVKSLMVLCGTKDVCSLVFPKSNVYGLRKKD